MINELHKVRVNLFLFYMLAGTIEAAPNKERQAGTASRNSCVEKFVLERFSM